MIRATPGPTLPSGVYELNFCTMLDKRTAPLRFSEDQQEKCIDNCMCFYSRLTGIQHIIYPGQPKACKSSEWVNLKSFGIISFN